MTTTLLDERELKLAAFDPALAEVLGKGGERSEPGCNVLGESAVHLRAQVQLRDWLYCLAKSPGTWVHKRLILALGQTPDRFVAGLEGGADDEDEPKGLPVGQLTSETVAPAVVRMLAKAESMAREQGTKTITDAMLTLAVLETADPDLDTLLAKWATEEGLKRFTRQLRAELGGAVAVELFDRDGRLDQRAFDVSGRTFCHQLREEAASLGAQKITTRHLLYTLLGNDSGLLSIALLMRGVDVKKDMHAVLSRELAKPGRKRNDALELTRDTLFDAVVQFLVFAQKQSRERGANAVGAFDLHRAFGLKHHQELARLLASSGPLDTAGLRAYLESAEPDVEEEFLTPLQRFSIHDITERIRTQIIGQDAAVTRIVPWIKRLRFGIPRDNRPAGVFLFLGPTGTGKTQLAKELARYVFGGEEMVLFLEMGQFQSKESMNMFIGAPPGYVGYGEGKLTNGLRDKPECVVLFDEIEKAHVEVFNTLLRFADEGLISDPAGPIRDGRKCIIVMTTNAGQAWLREHLKDNPRALEDPATLSEQLLYHALEQMRAKGFTPEFLGRVDEKICFLPFTLETCRKIVDRVLEREMEKFKRLKGITMDVDENAREIMAARALERTSDEGARGAPRTVNECIITPAIDRLTAESLDDEGHGPTHLIATGSALISSTSPIVVETSR